MKLSMTKPGAPVAETLDPFEDPKIRARLLDALKARLDLMTQEVFPGVALFKELIASDAYVKTLQRRLDTPRKEDNRGMLLNLRRYVNIARGGR